MGLFRSKQKAKQTTMPMIPGQVYDWASRYHQLSQTPFQFYPDQTYAAYQPEQEEALGMREAAARGMGTGMVDPAMAAWRSMLAAPDVANNPYVNAMLNVQADIAGRDLRESIPMIESEAIGMGGFGGSRQGVVEALRERGIREALAQSTAATQLGAYGQGLQQQQYGLGAAPGMAGFALTPANILGGVGAERRTEEQRAIDESMARFNFAQEEPWMRLERFVNPYMAMTGQYGTTETESKRTPSALQIGGQLLGMGLGAYGAYRGYNQPQWGMGMMPPMPAPTMSPGYGPMQPMYGMGSMAPRMGYYNPMRSAFPT